MASFDIVSTVDMQELDNAVNNLKKEVDQRYDFKGSNSEVELNKKDGIIKMETSDDMKIKAMREMMIANALKRNIDPKALEFSEPENTGNQRMKRTATLKQGIDKDNAKKIVKMIKDTKMKVQASIMDDKVRVQGKKLDDLQAVIQLLKGSDVEIPLQFENMKK